MEIKQSTKDKSSIQKLPLQLIKLAVGNWQLAAFLFCFLFYATSTYAQAVSTGTAPVLVPTGGFGIDGDLQANTPTAGIGDWLKGPTGSGGYVLDSLGNPINPGTTFHLVDPYGSNDNTFGGGNKADANPTSWSWSLGSANSKTDINNVLIHFSVDNKGHQWVIVAADRASNSGEAYLDFEFLQNTLTANSNGTFSSAGPDGGRTVGDFDLTFSTGGNFSLETWQGSGSSYDYVTYSAPAGTVYGANNTTSEPVSFGAFGSTTYSAGQFTEGAVDITALLGSVNPCTNLGISTILVKSKQSASVSASLSDFVTPIQVHLQFGVAQAGPNQALCSQGASTLFTMAGSAIATPGDTVKTTTWSVISGSASITTPSSLTSTVQVSSASATLLLTITTKLGCSVSDSVVLTVNQAPTASISGGTSPICSSTAITLTAVTNASSPTYLWSPGGATTSSISVAPSGSTTTYSVTVTGSTGCSTTSAGQAVTVNQPPSVTLTPFSLCEGASETLCANSSGSSLSYQWSNGLQDQCFTVTVPNTYSVVVTDGNNCTGTATVVIPLVQAPNLAVSANGPTSFCTGDSVTLTASGASSYSWNTGSTSSSIKVKNDGLYTVTGSNGIGCAISVLDYVTVYPSPVVTITPQSSTTFCQGGSVQLIAGGAATYIWSNSNTGLIVNATASGTYSVVGTDGNGCMGSAGEVVNVNPLPNVTLSSFSPVCVNGGSINLNEGSPSGGIYSGPGVSSNAFNPVTAGGVGSYSISYIYTNGNGCTNGTSSSITVVNATPTPGTISGPSAGVCANSVESYSITPVSGATSYTWTAPGNASITNGQGNNSVTVTFSSSFTSGTLSVVANGGCGTSSSSSINISSVPATPAAIFGDPTPCKKGINLYWVNPVAGATSYTWNVPAGSSISHGQGTDTITVTTGKKSGNITVTANNACGNSGASASLVVDVSCRTSDPTPDITTNNEIDMTVYPNPAHDLLNIKFTSSTENNYYLRIFDLTGRLVMEQVKNAEIGDNLIELNLNVAKGLYIVSLSSGDLNKQSKIIVQ